MTIEDPNFYGMSDEDILNMQPPEPVKDVPIVEPVVEEPAAVVIEPVVVEPVEEAPVVEETTTDDKEPLVEEPNPLAGADTDVVVDPVKKDEPKAAATVTDPKDADKDPKDPPADAVDAETPIDYKVAYEKIMAPFKANGREIKLESPEEAVKLMQMGANYTKKMQALHPTLRLVKMLENNKLLDETQLSYLIDLHQKKPEAIQKLLADSEFDPLEADVEKAAGYVPGDHRVGDNEVQFQTVLDDIESTPTGPELLSEVSRQWDADSKQALFKDPQLLVEINNQKANGLYGRISGELERRRVLGELQGVPFLAAYEHVGKDMQAKGLLVPKQEVVAPRQAPVVTRVVAPAATVANSERARAALPTKVTPTATKVEFNPLAQSDEDFLKSMEGRL